MATPQTTAVIASGQSASNIVALPGTEFQLTSFLIPSGWTAAGLVINGSYDGINVFPIYSTKNAANVSYSAAVLGTTGIIISVSFEDFDGIPYVQFVSSTTGSPVNQTSQRTIILQSRAFQ